MTEKLGLLSREFVKSELLRMANRTEIDFETQHIVVCGRCGPNFWEQDWHVRSEDDFDTIRMEIIRGTTIYDANVYNNIQQEA